MKHLYTIVPTDTAHIDEVCEDIRLQYESGVATCALFMAKLVPEGEPAIDKAALFAESYRPFRDRLQEMGLSCGILVQCTIGHGYPLNQRSGFTYYQNLHNGNEEYVTCPYDLDFQAYLRDQLEKLAALSPEVIMVDDDFRLMFRTGRGCACPLHMAAYHRATGSTLDRAALFSLLQEQNEAGEAARRIYVETQRESLLQAARAMREGIDAVDKHLPGIFCCVGPTTEFAADIAHILAGEGNPAVVRVNNGNYTPAGARNFAQIAYRAADEGHRLKKGGVDIILAETDTCPQNRYSTGAQSLHAHFTGSILEGASGAKHWITRLAAHEPRSGLAYRKKLAAYRGFYTTLSEMVPTLQWEGCRIPLPERDTYDFRKDGYHWRQNAWLTCVLERWGLPVYFSSQPGGFVFLEGEGDEGFSNEELIEMLRGNLVVDGPCLARLHARGLGAYTGVAIRPWQGKPLSFERVHINGNKCNTQVSCAELVPLSDRVQQASTVYHLHDGKDEIPLFPGVTVYKNELGGTVIATAGTPNTYFSYLTAFSYLTESRKAQFVSLLKESGCLPIYYDGDSEMYMKTAKMPDGKRFCAIFNLSLDVDEEMPLATAEQVRGVKLLQKDGSFAPVAYEETETGILVKQPVCPLEPMILVLDVEG